MRVLKRSKLLQTKENAMLNLKEVNKNITLIKTAGLKMDQRIHETVVSIMHHAEKHGDWTAMQRLYDAFPRSGRRKAFEVYVVDHTPLKFDDKLNKFIKPKSSKKPWMIQEANDTPFWDYTKEQVKALDVDKLLDGDLKTLVERLISREQKRIDAKVESGHITGNLLAFEERKSALLSEVCNF